MNKTVDIYLLVSVHTFLELPSSGRLKLR